MSDGEPDAARLPKVAVIVPAFNARAFLTEALSSLFAQTMPDWVGVVVDDGSTDGTLELAQELAGDEPRLKVVSQPNGGVASARNRGLAELRAELVAFLDADDLWLPDKLEAQCQVADEHGVEFVFCAREEFGDDSAKGVVGLDGNSGLLSNARFLSAVAGHCFALPSCVMIKTEVLRQVGPFDATLRNSEDWDLWWRIALSGGRAYGIDRPLCRYRKTPGGLSSQSQAPYWANMRVAERYLTADRFPEQERRKAFRLFFRNSFSNEGVHGDFPALVAMFDAYKGQDRQGNACRLMAVLRHLLPARLFWLVSRYFIIPLAWHLERWGERAGRVGEAPPRED